MSDYSFVEVARAGQRMCETSSECKNCPLTILKKASCAIAIFNEPELCQEIIMKWAKEHPVKTNADKFKEVYGLDALDGEACIFRGEHCEGKQCDECKNYIFWRQEYKEPKE